MDTLQDRTRQQYRTGVKHLREFIQELNPALALPLAPIDWAFLHMFLLERVSPASVLQYTVHVIHFQITQNYDYVDFKRMPLVDRIRRRLRSMAKAKQKQPRIQPLTWNLACQVADLCPEDDDDAQAFKAVMLCGVAGLFRLGELTIISEKEVDPDRLLRKGHFSFAQLGFGQPFTESHLQIWLDGSKTDRWHSGVTIRIPRNPDARYCPVLAMVKMLNRCKSRFAPVFTWPSTGKLMKKREFISRLRGYLRDLGYDPSLYAGHSLRRGGAITAQRAGVADHVIKALGRWSSDAYAMYLTNLPPEIKNFREDLAQMRKLQTTRTQVLYMA